MSGFGKRNAVQAAPVARPSVAQRQQASRSASPARTPHATPATQTRRPSASVQSLHGSDVAPAQAPAATVRAQAAKSRSTAAVLAFLLGFIGVHKFYLGRTGPGLLYLFFFWTLIPGLLSIIDFVMLLTTSDEAFAATYG